MLILSRKEDEAFTFTDADTGKTFTVQVARITGGRVTLAIEADDSIRVTRSELLEREKEPAA